jgi:hypothetical protein
MTRASPKGFRERSIIRHRIEYRKRRVVRRVDKFQVSADLSRPMRLGRQIQYKVGRADATSNQPAGGSRPPLPSNC